VTCVHPETAASVAEAQEHVIKDKKHRQHAKHHQSMAVSIGVCVGGVLCDTRCVCVPN
jgi:hypothetical protein